MPGTLARWGLDAQQHVHDASLHLQMIRARHCQDLESRGRSEGAQVVPGGLPAMQDYLRVFLRGADELLAVTAYAGDLESFGPTHENNRSLVSRGTAMLSLFSGFGLETPVRDVIVQADDMPYYLACGPLQMKVVDRRCVVLEGPIVDGSRSLLLLHTPEAVAAGLRYLRAVRATAVRAGELSRTSAEALTPRQASIASMLSAGLTDDVIAEHLGVSVRTVRTDVAALMSLLGTSTRFAAGTRYAQLFTAPS